MALSIQWMHIGNILGHASFPVKFVCWIYDLLTVSRYHSKNVPWQSNWMAKQACRLPEIAGWKLIYFWSLEITRHKSESFSWPELWTFPEYKSKDSTWKIKLPTLFGRWYWQEQLVPCHCHYKHFHSKYSINCFIVPTILIHSFPNNEEVCNWSETVQVAVQYGQ